MSILINDSSLYEDGGSLSNDLSTASNESTVIKIKLTSAYSRLNYKVKNKISRLSISELETIIEEIENLNSERADFAQKVNDADQKIVDYLKETGLVTLEDNERKEGLTLTGEEETVSMEEWQNYIGELPIAVDVPIITGHPEVARMLTNSGYDASLIDTVDSEILSAKYRPENNDVYAELLKKYNEVGPLTTNDVIQVLNAGNCSRFNQYSEAANNLFFSSNPYAEMGKTTTKNRRYISVNGQKYATCATGGCGPSTLNNISSTFFKNDTLTVVDTLKATYDNCHLNETDFSKIPNICADLGLSAERLNLVGNYIDYDDKAVIGAIDNGAMIMVSSKTKSGGGHYVAIIGYKEDANGHARMLVLDPANSGGENARCFFSAEGVRIKNGAYAITSTEGGIKVAENYHNQNNASYNDDKVAWEDKNGKLLA